MANFPFVNSRCHLKRSMAIFQNGRCYLKRLMTFLRTAVGKDIQYFRLSNNMCDNQSVTMKRSCRFRMTSFPTNHRDFIKIKMADRPDNSFVKDLITSAIKEVYSTCK